MAKTKTQPEFDSDGVDTRNAKVIIVLSIEDDYVADFRRSWEGEYAEYLSQHAHIIRADLHLPPSERKVIDIASDW